MGFKDLSVSPPPLEGLLYLSLLEGLQKKVTRSCLKCCSASIELEMEILN